MRVQAIFLVGLMVGMAGCSASDDSPGGTAGTGNAAGAAGTAGNGGSGNGGSGNGGSGNGGSGGTAAGGSGAGGATGGVGGTTGGVGGTTGGVGGTTGGSGGTTGGTGGTAGGTGGTAGGTGGTAGGTGGTAGGTGGTGGTTPVCTAITLSNFQRVRPNIWLADTSPELATADDDVLQLEFYGASTGTTNLSTAPDDNFGTCERCIRVFTDVNDSDPTQYFQSAGGMTLARADGKSGSISNVTLVEVTIADTGTALVSTPVPGGKCLTIASAAWAVPATCFDGGSDYSGASACDDCQAAEGAAAGCCAPESSACGANASCGGLITCLNGCAANDTTCINNCASTNNAGINDFNSLADCMFGPTAAEVGACGTACQ